LYVKVAVLIDSSREFRVSTSDLNHFAREETVLAGLRFKNIGIHALVSVDGGMELLSTRPWLKSKVDTRNSREESNITATLAVAEYFYFSWKNCCNYCTVGEIKRKKSKESKKKIQKHFVFLQIQTFQKKNIYKKQLQKMTEYSKNLDFLTMIFNPLCKYY
jgi:hypothetical protein